MFFMFSPQVSHVVTEYKDLGSVLRRLDTDSTTSVGDVAIVSVAWFSESMRAGRPVPVEDHHRIKPNNADMVRAHIVLILCCS